MTAPASLRGRSRSSAVKARRAAEWRGHRAEGFAAILLRLKGYRILERRFRSRAGAAGWAVTPRQQARNVRAAEH